MTGRGQQALVFVLADDFGNGVAEFAQVAGARRAAINAHVGSSGVGHLALDHCVLARIEIESVGGQPLAHRAGRLES